MFYTIINLGAVVMIFIYWSYQLIKLAYFTPYATLANHKKGKGTIKEAVIVRVDNRSGKTKKPLLNVTFEFDNFSRERIRETIHLTDTKYHLKRYEVGKRMMIKMDPGRKPNRPVQLVGANYSVNKILLSIKTIIIITYLLGACYLLKFIIDFIKEYPGRYQDAFANSGTFFMTIIFMVIFFLILRIVRGFGLLESKGGKSQNWDIKYYGIKTTAQIREYKDTGVMINDNPKVKFLYTFKDSNGQIIEGNDDTVIGKLEIGRLPQMKEMDIMYLPDHPHASKFVSNLNPDGTEGCIKYVLLFIAITFSFCLVVSLIEPIIHVRNFY